MDWNKNQEGIDVSQRVIDVFVDYDKSLAEMIKSSRLPISQDINDKNFSIQGSGQYEVQLVLVNFVLPFERRFLKTDEILAYFKIKNLMPARIEHLLAYAATSAKIETYRYFAVVALGSKWEAPYPYNFHQYPTYHDDNSGRSLSFSACYSNDTWHLISCTFFLAILENCLV